MPRVGLSRAVLLRVPCPQERDKKARAEVDEAVEWAKASPEPPLTDLFTQVYVTGTEVPVLRGRDLSENHRF